VARWGTLASAGAGDAARKDQHQVDTSRTAPSGKPNPFGVLLYGHRVAAGLSQAELAERAGLSARAISDLERGARRLPYPTTVRRLARALSLGRPQRSALLAARETARVSVHAAPVVSVHPAPAKALPTRAFDVNRDLVERSHNLPSQLSSFVGRSEAISEVRQLLVSARLLTLTGVGGCGKTRLALEVARSMLANYADGVWLVELGPVSDPAAVPHRMGAVLGASESAEQPIVSALASAVSNRPLLLVLDNCEHLLKACATLLNALLRACPVLQVLATSREPIGVDGEVVWRVPSLPFPEHEQRVPLAELRLYPSVRLFVERAAAGHDRFALTGRNATAVGQICRRLEGIPLAIELAAACVEALAPEQLADRLDQRFLLLTGSNRAALPRQQTLSATLDWSYALLSKPERRLFEQLPVFEAGWTLEAAEDVCAGHGLAGDDVLDLLVGLVRKSLVVVEQRADGAVRYRLLETIREYARQKLADRGLTETNAVRQRHAAFYSALPESLYPSLQEGTGAWRPANALTALLMERLGAEYDNLVGALGWWKDSGSPDDGLKLALALGVFCEQRGEYAQARQWVEALLEAADRIEPSGATARVWRARALGRLGAYASLRGDDERAQAFHEAAITLVRDMNDPATLAYEQSMLGMALWRAGDTERARGTLEQSLSAARTAHAGVAVATTLRNLGMLARSQGQYKRAGEFFREAVVAAQSLGPGSHYSQYAFARAVCHVGRVAYLQGDYGESETMLRQALGLIGEYRLMGNTLADCLDWLAALAAAKGQACRAARLFGAAETHWRVSGLVRYAPDRPAYERDVVAARAQLDDQAFAAAWAFGQAMSADVAIAYGLMSAQQRGRTPAPGRR
jgi:predicted ATPase/transcriptional regulator with XRE-family HTH domain